MPPKQIHSLPSDYAQAKIYQKRAQYEPPKWRGQDQRKQHENSQQGNQAANSAVRFAVFPHNFSPSQKNNPLCIFCTRYIIRREDFIGE